MAVNDKIKQADYNNIRSKVAGILGTGSINSGYGQTVRSTAVDESSRVTVREWGNLYYDIVNCYVHQTGALPPSITQVSANETVKTDVDATVINAEISGTTLKVYSVASGMVAIGQTVTGTGVSPGTIITAAEPQTSIAISGFVSAVSSVDDLTYDVTFTIPLQLVALKVGDSYTIAGNTNSNFNGTFVAKNSTTTSITLMYGINPGVYGSGTTTITPAISPNPWGRSNWTVNNSQTVSIRTMSAESSTIYPYTQYDTFANTIVANKFNIDTTQAAVVPKGTKSITYPNVTYGSFWNTQLNCTTTVEFTTADQARYFFNSGGEIRFVSQLAGSTSNAQTIEWTNLLSTAGTRRFGGNRPGTGTTPMDGLNFYRLTNVYQTWSTVSGSSPYTSNIWTIKAKCDVADNSSGIATQIDFLIEWVDGYIDSGPTPNPAPGDEVYGTMSLAVTTYEATGTMQPSGTSPFAVESPTVTVSDLTPDPVALYNIAPSSTTRIEGDSITFTISGSGIPDGTYSYEIVSSGLTAADFVDNTLTGSVSIASNSGSFTKTIKVDYVTDGTETFYARLKQGTKTLATSGTVTISDTTTALVNYMIVGGGGGGGAEGGGGAGGVLSGVFSFTPGAVYTITVGGFGTPGGLGGGTQGGPSTVSGTGIVTQTAQGGGAGATATRGGYTGGSGGGGAGSGQSGGTGTPGQGNNGGNGGAGGGGGGGGAGSPGLAGPAGRGGDGTPNTISGSTVGVLVSGTYYVAAGAGGASGGTNGVGFGSPGSGGSPGGNGVAGTVILRIPTFNYTGTKTGTSTVTTSGAYTIVQWTGSGSYTA